MTPERLRAHYLAVADASPLPVLLYQVPLRFSTIEFETGLVAELAQHERIVGMKDSRGDLELLGEIAEAAPRGFQLLVGTGAKLYAALQVGAVGGSLGSRTSRPAESPGSCRRTPRGMVSRRGASRSRSRRSTTGSSAPSAWPASSGRWT
jgi:dihydrodipicolinate synthase/N-acetylneuraminate lyase